MRGRSSQSTQGSSNSISNSKSSYTSHFVRAGSLSSEPGCQKSETSPSGLRLCLEIQHKTWGLPGEKRDLQMQRAAFPSLSGGAPPSGPRPDPKASRSFTGLCARRDGAERHRSRSPTTPSPLQDAGEVTASFPVRRRLHSSRGLRRPEVGGTPFIACPGSCGLSLPKPLKASLSSTGREGMSSRPGFRQHGFCWPPSGRSDLDPVPLPPPLEGVPLLFFLLQPASSSRSPVLRRLRA